MRQVLTGSLRVLKCPSGTIEGILGRRQFFERCGKLIVQFPVLIPGTLVSFEPLKYLTVVPLSGVFSSTLKRLGESLREALNLGTDLCHRQSCI